MDMPNRVKVGSLRVGDRFLSASDDKTICEVVYTNDCRVRIKTGKTKTVTFFTSDGKEVTIAKPVVYDIAPSAEVILWVGD